MKYNNTEESTTATVQRLLKKKALRQTEFIECGLKPNTAKTAQDRRLNNFYDNTESEGRVQSGVKKR
jgi:hypothetical protein